MNKLLDTRRSVFLSLFGASFVLSGCSSLGITTAVGPSTSQVKSARHNEVIAGIRIINLTDAVAQNLRLAAAKQGFSVAFGDLPPVNNLVGVGDGLDITIWEAPPATLFGAGVMDSRAGSSNLTSRGSSFPEFVVGASGAIHVPFAGELHVLGRSTEEIERDLTRRLQGKANQPQVLVRLVRNSTATATLVGELGSSVRLPLTPRGERLLDAIASAGGTRQPAAKITIQITRGEQVVAMPLEQVIRDPRQNITLQPNDVVTAIFQPYSFTALGATGRNAEIDFEATGLTLAQALGRIGGLQDMRADPKGVFIFRWEDTALLDGSAHSSKGTTESRVPVIYRVNLTNPATYFLAQNFDIRNKDVVYISNAPMAEFQRFVNFISATVTPVILLDNALKN